MTRLWTITVLLGALACGGGGDPDEGETEAGRAASEASAGASTTLGAPCERAFLAAANNAGLGAAGALDPTLQECASLAEWRLGAERHPGALGGADADALLQSQCRPGVAGAVCDELRRLPGA